MDGRGIWRVAKMMKTDELIEVLVYPDLPSLARAAAERVVNIAEAAVTTHGRFSVALSGGKTPRALYALLATNEYLSAIDWAQTHVFWGDERCVPPDHHDSNYHMAREALLDYAPLPMGNIYRMRGEVEPSHAADEYENALRHYFKGRADSEHLRARFDLVLLGLGEDGHTASLFPNSAALDEQERWVVAHHVETLDAWRITLTPQAINAAAYVIFLVTGANKAERLKQILSEPLQPRQLPAQLIQPTDGRLLWLVDRDAAALL